MYGKNVSKIDVPGSGVSGTVMKYDMICLNVNIIFTKAGVFKL